ACGRRASSAAPSCPTRRSADLNVTTGDANSKLELYVDNNTSGLANSRLGNNNRILSVATESYVSHVGSRVEVSVPGGAMPVPDRDRKSTRLNSSHVKISYAVCC